MGLISTGLPEPLQACLPARSNTPDRASLLPGSRSRFERTTRRRSELALGGLTSTGLLELLRDRSQLAVSLSHFYRAAGVASRRTSPTDSRASRCVSRFYRVSGAVPCRSASGLCTDRFLGLASTGLPEPFRATLLPQPTASLLRGSRSRFERMGASMRRPPRLRLASTGLPGAVPGTGDRGT